MKGIKILKEMQNDLKSSKNFKSINITNALIPELRKLYDNLTKISEKELKLEASTILSPNSLSFQTTPKDTPSKTYTIFSFCK